MFRLILRIEEKNQEIKENNMRKKIWCVFLLVVFLLMAFFMNSVNAAYDDYYDSYPDNYSTDDYYKNAYYSDDR